MNDDTALPGHRSPRNRKGDSRKANKCNADKHNPNQSDRSTGNPLSDDANTAERIPVARPAITIEELARISAGGGFHIIDIPAKEGHVLVSLPGNAIPFEFENAADADRFTERMRLAIQRFGNVTSGRDPDGNDSPDGPPTTSTVQEHWATYLRLQSARTIEEVYECLDILTGDAGRREREVEAERQRQAGASANRQRHYKEVIAAAPARIDALRLHADDAAREAERLALFDELANEAGTCPYFEMAVTLHRLWFKIAADEDERIDVFLSWRAVYAVEAEHAEAVAGDYERQTRTAAARANVAAIDGELVKIQRAIERRERAAKASAGKTASDTATSRTTDTQEVTDGASGNETEAGFTYPWKLYIPLSSMARLVEAMRSVGQFRHDLPSLAIVERLWSESSRARNHDRSYNAAKAHVTDLAEMKQAGDDHMGALILALALMFPPDFVSDRAADLRAIARGEYPVWLSEYVARRR